MAKITSQQNIDSVLTMVSLVGSFHTQERAAFPIELILAICWEESFFQNIAQPGGPAVGYGQLEGSARRIANQRLTGNPAAGEGIFTRAAILASPGLSIQGTSYALAELYNRLGRSQMAALNGYAGVSAQPNNAPIPGRWTKCATALRNLVNISVPSIDMIAVENALRLARNFDTAGPLYDHIHSRLWPLLEVLQFLFGQVQIGSQGLQVMLVQDAVNRLQNADSSSGDSLAPLALDGQFGPKTHSHVQGFQKKNGLVADGVVGPKTRGKLMSSAQASAHA